VKGVYDVVSGYSGGKEKNPTYRQVSAGATSHAEAVRVLYDSEEVSYNLLVEMFFGSHDPTTLNRQGPDVGPQYRSAIFYQTDQEKRIASEVKDRLDQQGKFKDPIVTEITKFKAFYIAEDYHQNYYELHPNQPYIVSVSRPKVEKFMKSFKDRLKDQYK
ncbi:MAG: peptide-methionine (S)-S-oxide reductase MsrA, partial [Cytophagales bacterium]|nr:peptide-methionine (S)-S-oxide reductase MsrA [Cytophagales bacterium]